MLRQLLTLLAVITGLGFFAEPSTAAQSTTVSVAAAGIAEDCILATAPAAQLVVGPGVRQQARPCRRPVSRVRAPTVMLQADRARE